jgi:predicted TIM-barrel fold metal-dependent hydrolase
MSRLSFFHQGLGLINGRTPGAPGVELDMTPGEYLQRAVRIVCSFPTDVVVDKLDVLGDTLAFGSDFPHAEGLADPLRDYVKAVGPLDHDVTDKLYGTNIADVLHPA